VVKEREEWRREREEGDGGKREREEVRPRWREKGWVKGRRVESERSREREEWRERESGVERVNGRSRKRVIERGEKVGDWQSESVSQCLCIYSEYSTIRFDSIQ
jgi:hypothetical protein